MKPRVQTALLLFIVFALAGCSSSRRNSVVPFTSEQAVRLSLKKVADWQIGNFRYSSTGNLHDDGINAWTNAALYIGMTEWAKISGDSTYYNWLADIGSAARWQVPANFTDYPKYGIYHADELCVGQFYLSMFELYGNREMIAPTKERIDLILDNPSDSTMLSSNKQSWTWCDALFMAPPVYVHMARIEGNDEYLRFMDREFKRTYDFLYDKNDGLFYRDSSYFDKTEANGEKIFWGRGNGWVAAGLANILKLLPENWDSRPFYENLFREFVPRLAALQNSDGFWHASLLDPESFAAPETSATALITYALAYGINNGLLDREKYLPVVEKSWNALLSAVDEEGKLGWVQPIGANPKKVKAEMTAAYGVGAFLLAGCEIYNINKI